MRHTCTVDFWQVKGNQSCNASGPDLETSGAHSSHRIFKQSVFLRSLRAHFGKASRIWVCTGVRLGAQKCAMETFIVDNFLHFPPLAGRAKIISGSNRYTHTHAPRYGVGNRLQPGTNDGATDTFLCDNTKRVCLLCGGGKHHSVCVLILEASFGSLQRCYVLRSLRTNVERRKRRPYPPLVGLPLARQTERLPCGG